MPASKRRNGNADAASQSWATAIRPKARTFGKEQCKVTLTIADNADLSNRRDVTTRPASFYRSRLVFRPKPGEIGQITHGDGGYLGAFSEGRPHGSGYCFTDNGIGGEACRYEEGERVSSENSVPVRNREEILAQAQGLSGQAAIDLLRRKMIDALSAELWSEYLRYYTDLQTLGADTGLEAIYYEARSLAELNQSGPAFDAVQVYLNLAGSSGAAYEDALALYAELEPSAEAYNQRKELERTRAREQRRAFCQMRMEIGATLCGCSEFTNLAPEANID